MTDRLAGTDEALEPAAAPGLHRGWLLALFGLSGAVALIYEVVWIRALLLLLGSTAAASSLVIALFVAGLGLGARWGGRRVARDNPLRLYALCELGAAAWATLALPLLTLLDGPYVAIAQGGPIVAWLLRALMAALVVLPSAFLLGATLPALVAQWVRTSGSASAGTAWLYGVNALGAAVGALLPPWWAFQHFGVQGTLYGAAFLGALVAFVAWGLARDDEDDEAAAPPPLPAKAPGRQVALLAVGAGALGLAIEVVGFRLLVFFVEGFTITFAAMLATFVAGLAAGSLSLGPWLVRSPHPRRALGALLAIEGLVLALCWFVLTPHFEDWMVGVKRFWFEGAQTPADVAFALKGAGLVGAMTLLFVPAFLLGPTFALCVRIAEEGGAPAGQAVGQTYLWNSAGSLLGPIVATFALIPWLGVARAWIALAILATTWGLWLLLQRPSWDRNLWKPWLVVPLAFVSFLPGPEAATLLERTIVMRDKEQRALLDVRTDALTTASVVQTRDNERILYTDDFAAAAVGRHYAYMRMLGVLPCLLAAEPKRTMVIAYGTGTTAGAVKQAPGVESIEVVEVSQAVLDLAHHFEDVSDRVLHDKRTTVIRDDGRNALRLHAPDLDVITLEPLMPYSPAGLPFYTREFYELARDRLRDGGVVCQWIPVHAMPAEMYVAFLRTFFEVFPDGTLWFFEQSTALIGRKGTRAPDAQEIRARMHAMQDTLDRAGVGTREALAMAYLANGHEILAAPVPGRGKRLDAKRTVRDLDPFPEFFPTPRARLSTPYLANTLEYLATLVDPKASPPKASWWPAGAKVNLRQTTATAMAARWQDAIGETLSLQIRARPPGDPALPALRLDRREALKRAASGYATVRAVFPDDEVIAWRRVRTLRRHARGEAMRILGEARALRPGAERRAQTLLAARILHASLPPMLMCRDAVASELEPTARVYVAALLDLGRCQQAAIAAHDALLLGAHHMMPLMDALHALQEGADPRSLSPRWIFGGAAPCQSDDRDALAAAFKKAATGSDVERVRTALMALERRARREVLTDALRAHVETWEPDPRLPVYVVRNTLWAKLEPSARRPHLTAEDVDLFPKKSAARLVEAAHWTMLDRHAEALAAFARSPHVEARLALANAVAISPIRVGQRQVVELLADEDRAVRRAAWTALLPHAKATLEAYRPSWSPEQMAPILETLRTRFAASVREPE